MEKDGSRQVGGREQDAPGDFRTTEDGGGQDTGSQASVSAPGGCGQWVASRRWRHTYFS